MKTLFPLGAKLLAYFQHLHLGEHIEDGCQGYIGGEFEIADGNHKL